MTQARLKLWTELPKASINPNIYGHFAEHLGRCIYEGIWVGPDSSIPNENGVRIDVLAALKQLRAPVVRWPGGCFADNYHWRDGIGPAADRPTSVNIWWRQGEPNAFGTDEYMRFCNMVGCEPYICLNVGSGSPEEALAWLEYCNFGGDSTLSRMRAQNGSPRPYGVRYWGVGNENWGCGGRFAARDYAKTYGRFAGYLKTLDPSIELIACGCSPMDYQNKGFIEWNHDFLDEMRHADLIDHLSIHRYFARGKGTGFNDSEYHALFGDLVTMERDIQQADRLLGYYFPDKQKGLIIDEWGVWHPTAVVDNGLEQESTLRDAVFAGAALNLFNQYAHRITMANIAQTVNVLQALAMTDGGKLFLTPTYHVFDMMRPHMGAQLLTQELDVASYEAHPVGLHTRHNVPKLSASASIQGRKVHVTVANQTADTDIEACITLSDARISAASGRILYSAVTSDCNSFDNARKVVPKRLKLDPLQSEVPIVFPAHSFTSVTITLE